MNGLEKSSLGVRYLLRYTQNARPENFDVVKNCISEIKFWGLHMLLCNNYGPLFECIPEAILAKVFNCSKVQNMGNVLDDNSLEKYDYGKGYHSNIKEKYSTQLRLIRNALAHNSFTFDGETINVYNQTNGFKASFDIAWLETAVKCLLSSPNYVLKKGTVDYSIVTIANNATSAECISSLKASGQLYLLKLTCSAENSDIIAIKFPRLATFKDRISFNEMKVGFLRVLKTKILEKCQIMSPQEAFKETLPMLKKVYRGIFDIEVVPIKEEILKDESFNQLSFTEGCNYITNKYSQENETLGNTIDLKSLLEVLDSLSSNNPLSKEQVYTIKNNAFYLLRLYSYILFANNDIVRHKNCCQVLDDYSSSIDLYYVHAQKVWSEYIKKISNALDTLIKSSANPKVIDLWEDRLRMYQDRLKTITSSDENSLLYRLRNSLIHDNVEEKDGNIVFYGEEPVIELPRLKKKTNQLVSYPWQNKSRTYEIVIPISTYLEMLDKMYTIAGMEIFVNIAKYRQRKSYLSS